MKNKQALDDIRNTEAGHIQIDYRIACAMSNFVHKPICPDGVNAHQIAGKIKEKILIKDNSLDFLLSKHLDTKMIPEIELSQIEDFPKLTKEQLINNIFYGSFQIKLCVSYIGDLIKNGKAYVIDEDLKKKIPNFSQAKDFSKSRIIAVEITSRHKRSKIKDCEKSTNSNNNKTKKRNYIRNFRTIYKVFIHYIPDKNNTESILGKILFLIFN